MLKKVCPKLYDITIITSYGEKKIIKDITYDNIIKEILLNIDDFIEFIENNKETNSEKLIEMCISYIKGNKEPYLIFRNLGPELENAAFDWDDYFYREMCNTFNAFIYIDDKNENIIYGCLGEIIIL
jgi:hypothetical protein